MCFVSTFYLLPVPTTLHVFNIAFLHTRDLLRSAHASRFYIVLMNYPTTPPPHHRVERGTVLWLTHDHGPGGLERWTIYIYIYIYIHIIYYRYSAIQPITDLQHTKKRTMIDMINMTENNNNMCTKTWGRNLISLKMADLGTGEQMTCHLLVQTSTSLTLPVAM